MWPVVEWSEPVVKNVGVNVNRRLGLCLHPALSLSGVMRAFFSNRALHQQHQKGEYNGNDSENHERVEIGKS